MSVGRVAEIWRYPVKSMAGQSLDHVEVGWNGLAGDRRWAFVRPDHEANGFPWLTIRELPELWLYRTELTEPERPDASDVCVTTPEGRRLSVTDPALAAALGDGVHLMKQARGTFDIAPVSVLTRASVAGVEALTNIPLQPLRFRPNLVVTTEASDFPEAAWVGCELRIGTASIRVDQRDSRCILINIDPETAEREPQILRAIATEQDNYLGVYGSVVSPGHVRVGDEVTLIQR